MDEKILQTNWDTVKERVSSLKNLSDKACNTWIKPLQLYGIEEDTVIIACEDFEAKDISYVRKEFQSAFGTNIMALLKEPVKVCFVNAADAWKLKVRIKRISDARKNAGIKEEYSFDSYIAGISNKYAHNAALKIAEDADSIYNPLYIYGDSGIGKTHLLHAIGNYVLEQEPDTRILYLSASVYADVYDSSFLGNDYKRNEIEEKVADVDLLLLDDLDAIVNATATVDSLFYLIKHLREEGKQIVIAGQSKPAEIRWCEERMYYLLNKGLMVGIEEFDAEVKRFMVKKCMDACSFRYDQDLLNQIIDKCPEPVQVIEGKLHEIENIASVDYTNVSELIEEWLVTYDDVQVEE